MCLDEKARSELDEILGGFVELIRDEVIPTLVVKEQALRKHGASQSMKVAYHQAGHVVAGHVVGLPLFGNVTIHPKKPTELCTSSELPHCFPQTLTVTKANCDDIDSAVVAALAGPVAEYLLQGTWNFDSARRDFQYAAFMGSYVGGDAAKLKEFLVRQLAKSHAILADTPNQRAVAAVAQELVNEGSLQSAQAMVLVSMAKGWFKL